MLDLSSKTGDLRDARGRPDVLPALRRRTSGSSRSTSTSTTPRSPTRPGSTTTTSSRRGATPTRSTASPTAFPYDGEVTVQVYRKDLYDAKGLKPADTYDELVANAKALNDPANRASTAWRCAASPAPARTCTSTRRCFRGFGGSWMQRQRVVVNSPEAVKALTWYVDTLTRVRAARGAQLELARHRRRVLAGHGRLLHRRAFVGRGDHQPGEVEGRRQDRLRALAEGPERQARDLDLELGLPDQRRAHRQAEEGDVAVHRVGGVAPRRRRAPRGSSPARPSARASTACRCGARPSSPRR